MNSTFFQKTEDLLNNGKLPIILVSFGSVVDVGTFTHTELEGAKAELKKAEENANESAVSELKDRIQLIEDSLAKETALQAVFEEFQKPEGLPQKGKQQYADFIWKYGKKPDEEFIWQYGTENYTKLTKNIYAKGWLPQKDILGRSQSACVLTTNY
jgi:hypothetical protein